MPNPQAWARECERYQRISDLRREQGHTRAQLRRLRWQLAKEVVKVLVLVAALVGWVLYLLGLFA